jgi:hypothetical protein
VHSLEALKSVGEEYHIIGVLAGNSVHIHNTITILHVLT